MFGAADGVVSHLELSQAQHPFAVAYDHLCHLQSLFKAQAHALRIAYSNLAFHLEPIISAFREFSTRADDQLDHQAKLLHGYEADMAMLPKVVVHESLFRRREKEETRRKTLVDWIHAKKMEQVRDWCQSAHSECIQLRSDPRRLFESLQYRRWRDGRAGTAVRCGQAAS